MPSPVAQRALDHGFPNDLIFTPQRAKEVPILAYQYPHCQLCNSFELFSFFCCWIWVFTVILNPLFLIEKSPFLNDLYIDRSVYLVVGFHLRYVRFLQLVGIQLPIVFASLQTLYHRDHPFIGYLINCPYT